MELLDHMKLKSLLVPSVAALCLATSQIGVAQSERTFADVYAECGIGAMLFNSGEGSDSGRTLAIISNATWDWGTTAHISNSSSEENCQGAPASTASFLYHNYDQIETDVAKGGGEHVDALMSSLQCSASSQEVVSSLRAGLVAGDASQYDKANSLYNALSAQCVI